MIIRPYKLEDDDKLMQLERRSPRGFPQPFVHFRRKFIDRANLYSTALTLVAIKDGIIVGVSSIAVKDTKIGSERVKVAYSFDTRVLPSHRRQGIGHAMVQEKLRWAKDQGAVGAYSLVVATNQESLGMVAKSAYKKVKMILYLQFQPYPMLEMSGATPETLPKLEQDDRKRIQKDIAEQDLFVTDLIDRVQHLDFQCWQIKSDEEDDCGACASISVFDQAKIYTQISTEAPWPRTEADIARLGRNLKLFDVVGLKNGKRLKVIFDHLRDDAVMSNVNKITWMIDRGLPVPGFVFQDASHQKDYWLLFSNFMKDWEPQWGELVYLDPRDL